MNPYNTAERYMPRNYQPKRTVTWDLHRQMRGEPVPRNVQLWAESNLQDGDYLAQYYVATDSWRFGRAEWDGTRCRIVEQPEIYP